MHKADGSTLEEGVHFTVSYENNVNKGDGYHGSHGYSGSRMHGK